MKDTETVITELKADRDKLVGRAYKLEVAIDRLKVSESQRSLMIAQANVMGDYISVLGARIADLEATHD
jgi:hypothetical protein